MKTLQTILCATTLFASAAFADDDAVAVGTAFAKALGRFDIAAMVETLHPEMIAFFRSMAIHIAKTTEDEAERSDLFTKFGVDSIQAMETQAPREVARKFLDMAFGGLTPAVRDAAENSQVKVIGSIPEGDLVHVFYRTNVMVDDLSASVPSVITLRRHEGKWMVINTTQFEKVKARAIRNGMITR